MREPAGGARSEDGSGSERGPRGSRLRGALFAGALGFAASSAIAGGVGWALGCSRGAPPGESSEGEGDEGRAALPPPAASAAPAVASASPSAAASAMQSASPPAGAGPTLPPEPPPWDGPLLGSVVPQAPIYAKMEGSQRRIGYIRQGSKVPVDPKPTKNDACPQGWYKLVDGGFVCGRHATLDLKNPHVRLGIVAPKFDEILPYRYAHNAHHGTPLYRSVPSKEEMHRYEPYLLEKKKKKRDAEDAEAESASKEEAKASPTPAPPADDAEAAARAAEMAGSALQGLFDAGAPGESGELGESEQPEKPWWQKSADKKSPLNVTLAELEEEKDGTLAKRMVKGFYLAVDKSFGWNGRLWYKSTSGLVAPADRMWLVKAPASQGVDFPAGAPRVGFITGSKAKKYALSADGESFKAEGSVDRHAAFGLTGETKTYKKKVYRKTTAGWWMKGVDGTYTDPGPLPAGLAPGEKWIDVNIARKTLVLFEGETPVYAALVSPGKRSKIKKKDHRTKTGSFRIREKHVAATMDGDGTVAGDLPYSIEDVPYVQYYDGSYALHTAFWHNSFGYEMSHGCVNLSPLDAKKIFLWSEPRLPRGWHGVYATEARPGTLVVVHDGNES